MSEEQDNGAEEVYVLLKKNYRISRNIRLLWFFNNILKDIETLPRVAFKDGQIDDNNGHEIQILSWNPQEIHDDDEKRSQSIEPIAQEESGEFELEKNVSRCTLQPETKVNFLSRGYRLVFALDLSPSAFRIDAESYRTVAEGVLSRLADCLCCLVQPFQVPNNDAKIQPSIYVTVFAQARPNQKSKGRYKQDVIVQGCLLTPQSVLTILNAVECKIYHGMKEWVQSNDLVSSQPVRHDHGLVSILRTGLLALHLLPSNTSAGIIVLTDGVVGMPDMAVLETLLNQLRSTTTSCSFLHLKSSQAVFCDYGYSANIELLKFISSATYGTFFKQLDNNNLKDAEMNIYQKGLLVWQFQLKDDVNMSADFELPDVRNWEPETDLRYTPTQKNMYISPVLRKKHLERTLRVSIFTLLSVRLREGYMISSMSLGKNRNQLEVILLYPWNHGASIKYIASSAWPVVRNITKIEVYIEATYEFLYDVTVGLGHENWGRYRSMAVRRFKHFMKGLTQTDHMMTHLVSFTTDPVYYTISQKLVPLFYLPPNSNQLVLSMPSMNDSSKSVFAGYWKPVLSLDISIWQKWMHTHHIDIILQHDIPLPKHLHVSTKSGRFHSIQTSTAMSQLTSLLREWCTFVLLENHSYVKFTYKENEEKPSAFYVVRLSSKAPIIVIRLAFQIGTPGSYRNQILSDLRDRVLALTFPSLSKQPSNLNLRATSGVRSRNPSAQTRTRNFSGSERSCAVLVHKPLDRILIRYDQTPRDFMQPPTSGYRHGKVGSSNASSRSGHITGGEVGSTSLMQDLCRYLEHSRCVWSITNKSATPIPLAVAGQMASLLIKLRLSEGFNFASSSSGVISMVREFPMILNKEDGSEITYYCLAQFIMFPPTVCTSRESFSLDGSDDDEEDTAEADGELFLATEMWIEPQCGFVVTDSFPKSRESSHHRHASGFESGRSSRLSSTSSSATTTYNIYQPNQKFLGSAYQDIPKVVANEDRLLLSILVTIEHLRLMCEPKSCVMPTLPQQFIKPNKNENQHQRSRKPSSQSHLDGQCSPICAETRSTPVYEGITHYPCLFDLVSLLDRCPRVKLLFMTLSQGFFDINEEIPSPNVCLFDLFHQSLSKISDQEAILSDVDCFNVTKHMIKREEESNLFKGEQESDSSEDDDIPKTKWKCYLIVLPKGKIMITLLPATFKDLEELAASMPDLANTKSDVMQNIEEEVPESMPNPGDVKITQEKKLPSNPQEVSLSRDDYRLARRRSIKRITSVNSNKSDENLKQEPQVEYSPDPQPQINLPVFVYQCTTSNIVEQLLKDPTSVPHNISNLDVEQDYRPNYVQDHFSAKRLTSPRKLVTNRSQSCKEVIKSVDSKIEPESSSKHRFFRSQSYPFHQTPGTNYARNEGFFTNIEDVFGSSHNKALDSDASSLCETLVDVYHRCFVRAVAKNLKLTGGSNIASIDVQAATDAICLESVQEIDITQFLLITCPQVAAFRNQHLSQEMIAQSDDVFSMDVGPHIPVARVEPMIRHTSSTSSATDPSQSSTSSHFPQKKTSSESPEQKTRGNKNQVSGINRQTHEHKHPDDEIGDNMDDSQKHSEAGKTGTLDKSSVRSAFKKLRKRPQSLPKPGGIPGKDIYDTDGDTPESEVMPPFSHIATNNSAPALSNENTPNHTGSLPRSLKISKPLKKLLVTSKVGWEDLPEFPINLLKECHPRHISGTDDQVKMNFLNLLSQNFYPVHTMPDIFYYNVQDHAISEDNHGDNHENSDHEKDFFPHHFSNRRNLINNELVTESDLDVKFEVGENDFTAEADFPSLIHDKPSTMSSDCNIEKVTPSRKMRKKQRQSRKLEDVDLTEEFQHDSDGDSLSSNSSYSFYDEDGLLQTDDNDDENVPLFLCMTCTIRDKKTGNHGTMPVEGLPTNLQSVLTNLERPCESIDLSQLYITLDLIWMTLPADLNENEHTPDINDYNRFTSGLLPEEDDSPRHEVSSKKERIHTVHDEQETVDPLYMLPAPCLAAVNLTKEQIEWLLKDEIISALRTCESIDSSTLEKVTAHIDESDKTNCMVENTLLQFVFGADKSLPLFNIEFERIFKDFKGYRMKKEGDFYYFTTERTFLPIPNWRNVPFLGENEIFQSIDQQTAEGGNLPPQRNTNVQSITGSTSSGGRAVHEIIKSSLENEHTTLRRTKTAPNSLKSPSVSVRASTKSCTSLPIAGCPIHSSLSFRSLPNNEIMSVDAIESDVVAGTESSASTVTRQTSSSKSTPIRKTSALDIVSPDIPFSNNNDGLSPRGQQRTKKYARGGQSRLSLPNAITPDMCQDCRNTAMDSKRGKRRGPIKQRSMESNLNMSGKYQLKRHSTHTVTPLSLRNSPQQYSGPTSPMVRHLSGHNSSFGSSGSAPACHRRSAHNITPVTQMVQRETVITSGEPSSSTPMLRRDNSGGNEPSSTTPAAAIPNSAYLFGAGGKDAMSSPVSLSDGEFHRYSTASWFESGYDGEESDIDGEDDYMVSLHDSANDLPSFWLIVHVLSDHVKTYFHRRSSAVIPDGIEIEHKRVFNAVIEYIHTTCKRVNQTLLLHEMHDSRMCNALLVEETEEDIWKRDYHPTNFGHSDEHGDDTDRALLAATMTNAPGQFACDAVLETAIQIHPRLKATGNIAGKSNVMAVVRDLVINFIVTNRKNMFVYRLPDKSVFYCRMEEDTGGKPDSRRSSQLLHSSVDNFGNESADRRTSKESLTGVGLTEPKSGGTLALKWHGVGPLLPQQQEELEKMNQVIVRRLSESVLEKITVLLQRNSKLSSSDILFIQPSVTTIPNTSTTGSPAISHIRQVSPNTTLSYGLPDEFSNCLPAVRYYLHQNLLQIMAMPRYVDPAIPSGQFVGYKMMPISVDDFGPKMTQATDSSVFLFYQTLEPGKTGYGIACIVLEVTDKDGGPMSSDIVLKFNAPEKSSTEQLLNLTEIADSQRVTLSIPGSRSNTPAMLDRPPSSLQKKSSTPVKTYVRFHLWLKGSLTVDYLDKRLHTAVRHALFDAVTELLILRPPLCDLHGLVKTEDDVMPLDFQKSKRSHSRFSRKLSLPTPVFLTSHSGQSRQLDIDSSATSLSAGIYTDASNVKTDAMRSLFGSLNDSSTSSSSTRGILTNLLHPISKEDQNPKQNVTGKKSSPAMTDRRKSASSQAEEGELGNLRDVYKELSKTWFDKMEKHECPSVFKLSMDLSSMSQMKNTLQDMQKILGNILIDCRVKSFICQPGKSKMSAFSFGKDDFDKNKSKLPGKYPTYVLIARNFLLWRKAVGCFTQSGQQGTSKTAKFSPYDSMFKPEQSPRPHEHRLSSPCAAYIPRQQFVIVHVQSRSVKVWGYNMSNETARNLQVKLSHCIDFHNARRRALDCITFQKLSLFRHCTFQSGFSQQHTENVKKGDSHTNSFTQDVKDVDLVLINSKLPSDNELQSQRRSKSNKRVFFNEAYLSNTPVKPLCITHSNKDMDVATQYAHQYLEMKANLKKRGEEQQHLLRVFSNWRERPGSISNVSITKEVLQVLLRHSRVIHHVTSPMLFNPHWRKQILELRKPSMENETPVPDQKDIQVSKRQKRLSGVMRKSGDFTGKSYEDAKSRSRSNSTQKENANKGSKGNLSQLVSESLDDTRYDTEELRRSLMMHYVQYWQSMNFIMVKDDKTGRTDKLIRKSSSIDKSASKNKKSRTQESTKQKIEDVPEKKVESKHPICLYRVSAGGIVIVEISCAGRNFSVKLHVIEASRLQYQQNLNQQMTVLFLNDCEHLKDDTHLHSFTYDFHLRYIQMYVQDRQTAIKPGYHIVSLLKDFIEYYQTPPSFVFNQIYQGVVKASCSHVTAEELYEYVVGKQASHHGFKTLKLIDNEVSKNEHALVSSHLIWGQFHSTSCNKDEHGMYDVGYVIWHDLNSTEEKKVKLNFFVLFTNRRHLFPRFDRMEGRPHLTFPVRRRSSNLVTRTSQEKIPSTDKTMSPAPYPSTVLNVKQQGQSPTSSQSTSSLQKLANQATTPTNSAKKEAIHLSPLSSRKFNINAQARETFAKTKSPTESIVSPTYNQENVFYTPGPPSLIKRKLISQGRRQSMPNVGTLPLGIRRNPQDPPRQATEFLQMQNSTGHSVRSTNEDKFALQEEGLPSFVQCEISRLKDFLKNICASAEIQCYRNQLWDKVYMDKPSPNKTSMLPVEDFEHLLKHCQKVPLQNMDFRGHDLCNIETMGIQWAIGLQKRMLSKFNQICRFYTNSEGTKRYLGILNPKLYFMMLLITVDTENEDIGMFIVMRDKCPELDRDEPNLTIGNPIFIPLKQHLNNMINFICYYTWTSLLSN
uniref:KICSTOR complex protein SZT2-like isoform X2 n=1 Tax=Styela clava TaxID=7725 RepID=UPI00193990F4|nr:KICSTOR complex protein SZT2-like isoform X2 [Styela clava]